MLLPDAVDTSNSLELEGGVDERFAEEDVAGVDEVQAGRLRFGVEEEAFGRGIVLEFLDSTGLVDGRVADTVVGECAAEDDEEVAELGEDDGFGEGVGFTEPEKVSTERVDFRGERGADEVDVLDLGEGILTYLRIYARLLAGRN